MYRKTTQDGDSLPPLNGTEDNDEDVSTENNDEDALIEKALEVRDAKVISTTMKEIDSSLVGTLISKLTARLASNPLRAESLTPWLSHCLKQGRFQSQQQSIQLLAPLRNLICERTESLPDLLLLEGRLTSMCDIDQ